MTAASASKSTAPDDQGPRAPEPETGTPEPSGLAQPAPSRQPGEPEPVRLRALVISDIHAVTGSQQGRESWADMSEKTNPISELPAFLKRKEDAVEADVVLCPGDLGHKADPAGATWAWERLHEIAAAVGADHVVATAGNHDVDSRHQGNSLDPRDHLKSLDPFFPMPPEASADRYWARSMTFLAREGWRIVTLDSCFHHAASAREHERGMVEGAVLDRLAEELEASDDTARVNILLCHHHPMPHTELNPTDRSAMQGGDRLVDLLDRDRHGRWLIVHGHKHFPWLRYAGGSSISPVLLSAGSASISLYQPLSTRVRNQIHLIEFDTTRSDGANLHLAATFRSWTWASGPGWMLAGSGTDGLPGVGGFGFRVDLADLARQVTEEHAVRGRKTLHGSELLAMEPRLSYLAPIDLTTLSDILRRDHGVALRLYQNGSISETATP